jgi:hypothetical protein
VTLGTFYFIFALGTDTAMGTHLGTSFFARD